METEANKSAAERFSQKYLDLGHKVIRPDVEVDRADLKRKCIVLFGRPETNRVTALFRDAFPIRFEKDQFHWSGKWFNRPTQATVQVVENPVDTASLLVLFAGNSGESILQLCDSFLWRPPASFEIFDGDNLLTSGDWEPGGDLVWKSQANGP